MLQKRIIHIIIGLLCTASVHSQVTIRHLGGVKEAKAGFILSNYGMGGKVGGNYYFTNRIYYQVAVSFETGTIEQMNYQRTSFLNSVNYSLYNKNDKLFIDVKSGVLFGYDYADSENETTINEGVIYGAVFGVEAKQYLSDKIALFAEANQFVTTSDIGGKNNVLVFGVIYTIK